MNKTMNNEVLIKAEHISKKFCCDFKRSLWYGMKDIGRYMLGQDHSQDALRKDEFWAVKDINFEIRRGECLGLIGHNGAGKSTLLKMLNGLINPDQGKITMRGRVGALIELGAGFNPVLTGRENIYNNGAVLGFTRKEIDEKFDAIVDFSEIGEFIDAPVQNYSSGMKVRLGFAVAAQMEPDVLLIDEVLAVGDVSFRFKCLNRIGELLKTTAVVFVSHAMPQIHRISSDVMVMNKGLVEYQGNNVSFGVDKYYSFMNMTLGENLGNDQIELAQITLSSNGKSVTNTGKLLVKHNDNISIDLNLLHHINNTELAVQLVIWNQEIHAVSEVMGDNNAPIKYRQKKNIKTKLQIDVNNVVLNGGRYSIEVVIHSHDFKTRFGRFLPNIELQVEHFCFSGANTILKGALTN